MRLKRACADAQSRHSLRDSHTPSKIHVAGSDSKQDFKSHLIAVHQIELWAMASDLQQCGILISVDSDEPLQPFFKLKNSKWCSFSSLTILEYSSDLQRLWSDCAYAQPDLRLGWSHIPHCWKSRALAHFFLFQGMTKTLTIIRIRAGA